MLEALRAWLNGTREYNLGVSIYIQLGDNEDLKTLLKKGKTDYCHARLQKELLAICVKLKNDNNATINPISSGKAEEKTKGYGPQKINKTESKDSPPVAENANPDLYAACKLEANKIYKEAMNTRAVVFSMVPSELYEDPNRPDLVSSRREMCLKVVKLFNEASKLYDTADYVRKHGQLEAMPPAGDDMDAIADHLVKSTLDNKRKNFNKIKAREQTPERVVLMQKHAADIKKLEDRWHSLK